MTADHPSVAGRTFLVAGTEQYEDRICDTGATVTVSTDFEQRRKAVRQSSLGRIVLLVSLLAMWVPPTISANEPAFEEREVSFQNGDVELHGTHRLLCRRVR